MASLSFSTSIGWRELQRKEGWLNLPSLPGGHRISVVARTCLLACCAPAVDVLYVRVLFLLFFLVDETGSADSKRLSSALKEQPGCRQWIDRCRI